MLATAKWVQAKRLWPGSAREGKRPIGRLNTGECCFKAQRGGGKGTRRVTKLDGGEYGFA